MTLVKLLAATIAAVAATVVLCRRRSKKDTHWDDWPPM